MTPKPRFARDHVSAKPGEIVAVDEHGKAIGPARVRNAKIAGVLTGAALGATAAFLGGTIGLALGVGTPLVLAIVMRKSLRAVRDAQQVNALVFAGRRDEARAVVAKMPRDAGGIYEAQRLAFEAGVASMFGEHATTVASGERALQQAAGPKRAVFRDSIRISLASTYAQLGDLEAARRHRQAIETTPHDPILRMYLCATDLMIAFAADSTADIPDDDALHEHARTALGFHSSASVLVLLAWAFMKREEPDMARLLLDSVEDKTDAWFLADAYPRVAAWRAAQPQASGGDDDFSARS